MIIQGLDHLLLARVLLACGVMITCGCKTTDPAARLPLANATPSSQPYSPQLPTAAKASGSTVRREGANWGAAVRGDSGGEDTATFNPPPIPGPALSALPSPEAASEYPAVPPVRTVAYRQADGENGNGAENGNRDGGFGEENRPFGNTEQLPPPLSGSLDRRTNVDALGLDLVVQSAVSNFPAIRAAAMERNIARGKQVAARGEFDLKAKAFSVAQPKGFYKQYRNGVSLEQPTFRGGYLYGGYKLGRGLIEPWFQERQSNDGGEFTLAVGQPLLQNRAFDERRAGLIKTNLQRQAAEPIVFGEVLDAVRLASYHYWSWIASGQAYEAQEKLLQLAEARVEQIEERIKEGDLKRIAQINNDQLIAARETKVIEARRKLQLSAIKLSLFFRTPNGQPIVASDDILPTRFPKPGDLNPEAIDQDIATALGRRPELTALDLEAERVRVELAEARNSFLPKVDAVILASKDVGGPSSSKNDKGPFILEAGLSGELPIQRRKARGKMLAAQSKLAQLSAKRELTANKITAEVQDVVSAMVAASERIERAKDNRDLAARTLELARDQFAEGDIEVVTLNIYETSLTEAEIKYIEAQVDFFLAAADYRAILALPPLGSR